MSELARLQKTLATILSLACLVSCDDRWELDDRPPSANDVAIEEADLEETQSFGLEASATDCALWSDCMFECIVLAHGCAEGSYDTCKRSTCGAANWCQGHLDPRIRGNCGWGPRDLLPYLRKKLKQLEARQ